MRDIDKSKEQLIHEITAMRQEIQAMIAMHESEARFTTAFNSSPIPMCITTFPEGRYVSVNESFITLSGYSRQEILGKTSLDLNIWFDSEERLRFIESLQNHRTFSNEEIRFRPKSGEVLTTLYFAENVSIANKNYILSSAINITDLKQAQDALQRSEKKFKTLAENSPDIIVRFTKNLKVVYINPAVESFTELSASEIIAGIQPAGIGPESIKLWKLHLHKVLTTNKKSELESTFTNFRGQKFYYQARFVPEFGLDGSVEFILCTIRDITALKKTEIALRISEDRKRHLLATIPDLLFHISKSGVYLGCHGAKTGLLFAPPDMLLGKNIREVLPIDQAEKIMFFIEETISSGQQQTFEYQLPINGHLHFFEARVVAAGEDSVLFIARDVTELKDLQNEIARLDRLNLVGEMAASIGHEVRNPLTTVRGFLQMLSRKNEYLNFSNYFEIMIDELDRANAIISEFLSLAKNKAIHLEPLNLNVIIKSLEPLIQADATISNKILRLELTDIPDILADAKEIRQLVLNLARNGLEAMSAGSALTIKTFQDESEVILAIQDEGHGIPPEVIDKLWTPFFTTKETGTGLGLAICYSIANRHKAIITFDTGVNGTTFFVRFKPNNDALYPKTKLLQNL